MTPAGAQERPIIIHGATIHPVTGEAIENGYIVFDNGVITDLGRGVGPNIRGAERIAARGKHVWPGLISTDTDLGLVEVSRVSETVDHTEYGSITPEVRAIVAVNPDTDLIPVARYNGILTAQVTPRGGLISGRPAVIRMDGWTWEDLAIVDDGGLVINWPSTDPVTAPWMRRSVADQRRQIAEDLQRIDDLFDDAEAYIRAKDNDETMRTDMRFESMRAVLAGEKPVYVRASRMGQIESAVTWAARRGLDLVILGGHEADHVIPLLKKHDVAVIIAGTHRLPSQRHTDPAQPFSVPAKLHEAGVRIAIGSGASAAHERNLNHNVGTAVAFGLPKEQAIRAVTIDAAELLGIGETHGSLEVGKQATLIVTTGHPLEITTSIEQAYIDGRRIALESRHTQLYEKYREKYRQMGKLD